MRTAIVVLMAVTAARAGAPAPFSMPLTLAGADAVFVGTVDDVSAKTVPSPLHKDDTRPMRPAMVSVSESLLGGAAKKVEVGYFPMDGARRPGLMLAKGKEYLFFVTRNPGKKGAFVAGSTYAAHANTGPAFKAMVDEARTLSEAIRAPKKALADKDAGVRVAAAYVLIARYQTAPAGGAEREPVPADESKMILEVLAAAEWKAERRGVSASAAFSWMPITAADGWTPPKDLPTYADAAKKWLKENAGKYRMTRFARGPDIEP